MSTLVEFLIGNPIDDLKQEVIVSERLKDFPFTIKAMTGPEFARYQTVATVVGKKQKVNFDNKKFQEQVILNHVVEPSFKSSENLEKGGFATPEAFLYKSLLAGEIAELANKISELSGFDIDEQKLVDEAKND